MSDRHILFILDYFRPYIGGIETLFYDLTQDVVKHGYEVTVITSRHDILLQRYAKEDGVKIIRVGRSRWSIIPAVLWYSISHRSLLRTVDHIHTSTFASGLVAWLVAKIYRKTITITIHELYDTMRKHLKPRSYKLYLRYEYVICRLSRNKIIAVSEYTKHMIEDIHHIDPKNILVIYNQIDTTVRQPSTIDKNKSARLKKEYYLTDSTNYLFVGRLGYEKGLPYLIEARDRFINTNHTTDKLTIIAPRTIDRYNVSIQQQIQQIHILIKDNALQDTIIWIDPVQDDATLQLWMANADIGVVPSMSEGFCYTAVQMQAMGLPLIVSDVGALPEVLFASNTLFVPYGKIEELYDALLIAKKTLQESSSQSTHDIRKAIDYKPYRDLRLSMRLQ